MAFYGWHEKPPRSQAAKPHVEVSLANLLWAVASARAAAATAPAAAWPVEPLLKAHGPVLRAAQGAELARILWALGRALGAWGCCFLWVLLAPAKKMVVSVLLLVALSSLPKTGTLQKRDAHLGVPQSGWDSCPPTIFSVRLTTNGDPFGRRRKPQKGKAKNVNVCRAPSF